MHSPSAHIHGQAQMRVCGWVRCSVSLQWHFAAPYLLHVSMYSPTVQAHIPRPCGRATDQHCYCPGCLLGLSFYRSPVKIPSRWPVQPRARSPDSQLLTTSTDARVTFPPIPARRTAWALTDESPTCSPTWA